MDISRGEVPGSNRSCYIPNFVTADEEVYLIRKIQEMPQPQWRQLANRRLQTWGGDLTPKNVLIPQAMPSFMTDFPDLITRLHSTGVFASSPHQKPNHIIMNEYLAGQGIMPHEDGPSYHPVVATLSLGSHTVMHYYRYASDSEATEGRTIDPAPVISLLLEPRSLVVTTAALYSRHLHGIAEVETDAFTASDKPGIANADLLGEESYRMAVRDGGTLVRGTRYSLTCRDVERVASVNPSKVFGARKR